MPADPDEFFYREALFVRNEQLVLGQCKLGFITPHHVVANETVHRSHCLNSIQLI